MHINQGDKSSGKEHIEAALQLARRLGDEDLLSFVLARAAYGYSELGDFSRWYPLFLEQIELDHRLGNRFQEAIGLGNLGSGFLTSGMYKQGRELIEQAIQIHRSLGARRPLAYDLDNLGGIYQATGDLRKARQLAEEALQEISPTKDAKGKTFILNDLGFVLLEMGDAPASARRFIEAHALALSHELFPQSCESINGLAACAILQGQLDEARNYAQQAWDYLREHGWIGMGNPGKAYHICAETFDALGDTENAQAVIEAGHQALMEVADTKNIPSWRQSFLENVPDHRAIMEMWERRSQSTKKDTHADN